MALVVGLLVWQSRSNGGDSGMPSADDGVDRTVGLLTVRDPVCDEWTKAANELSDKTRAWSEADKSRPASEWDDEQRQMFDEAAAAMTTAADRFESALPNASHVVLKELIAQTIIHLRAYVAGLPGYEESDALVLGVATNFGSAVTFMCTAVPLVRQLTGIPNEISRIDLDADLLQPLLSKGDAVCDAFLSLVDRQNTVLRGWDATDPAIAATDWTPEQRRLNMAVQKVLDEDSEQAGRLAAQSSDPVMRDLLFTYGVYVEAYATKLPGYEPDDNHMWRVATYIGGGVAAACEAR
ncbi:hypothetical protein [Mycobacterium sp. SMC-4]|uniref:hypothetical protein n=1 Tax=Mycobacterium sp. SMC-4 TaxID=2857059 RepID=UPI003D03F1E5